MADHHAYLSGAVRTKLAAAEAAALDPAYEPNILSLHGIQPADLRPSDITTHLGTPWIPASDVVAVVTKIVGTEIKMHHMPELGSWTVEARQLGYSPKEVRFPRRPRRLCATGRAMRPVLQD